MKIAVLKKTNEQVQVIATNGGWSSVRTQDGAERKVRNGELTEPVVLTGEVAKLAEQKVAKAAKAPKVAKEPRARRAPMPLSERKNGKVDALYLQFYQKTMRVGVNGTNVRSIDNGDSVAQKMRTLTFDEIYKWAAQVLGQSERSLRERFAHLNAGMQRMNLGNMVRRFYKGA
jgi:hypothetical protein